MQMNRWVNPPPEMKTENEYAVTYTHANTFNTMKKQVGKKKVSRKSKKERIADKSISLSERLGEE